MEYTQNNPLPRPASGTHHGVESTIKTVFDWQYALDEAKLMALYEKGKTLSWNATEIDWSRSVDVARMSAQMNVQGFFNDVLQAPRRLGAEEAIEFRTHQNALMLSQFLHGEQGALLASARIVETVPWAEAKFYAAVQVMDEARHVEVYHRYLTEKLGISYEVQPALETLLDDIVSVDRIRRYKPHPDVYDMITTQWRLYPDAVSFQSSNRWDVAGASRFGFRTIWINRAGMPDEYPEQPAGLVLPSLDGVVTAG